MSFPLRLAALGLAALTLAGCGIFGDKDEDELEPVELQPVQNTLDVRKVWSNKVGGDAEFLRVALQPVGDGSRLYAASRDGNVVAYQPDNGKTIWRTELDTDLSAGPGAGENIVVVATADGFIVALEASSGAELWRASVDGEALARPAIKDESVVVQTIDNRLFALSVFDGSERWVIEQTTPVLTVRGSASPVIVGPTVIAGFDNGRLLSVDLDTGDVEWESLLAAPTGRSDLERLADVDGAISVVGQDVYASGYQGNVAAVAAESGQILWARDLSSYEGVAADWNNIYTVTQTGEVVAMTRRTGDEQWRSDALLRREPTLPVSYRTAVVVGDLEGYLHFFNNFSGELVARERLGGAAITADPVVIGDRLFIQSDSGEIAAFSIPQPTRPEVPDVADDGA